MPSSDRLSGTSSAARFGGSRLSGFKRPTDPDSLGFDFNAGLAAKVDECLELALAISAGVDHLLEDFFALQEMLVVLVPDGRFNDVFQAARLTALRVLLASIAGRIEVVTDSPGLHVSPEEAREIRTRVAAGEVPYGDDTPVSFGARANVEGSSVEAAMQSSIATLRQKLARIRESAEPAAQPTNGTVPAAGEPD